MYPFEHFVGAFYIVHSRDYSIFILSMPEQLNEFDCEYAPGAKTEEENKALFHVVRDEIRLFVDVGWRTK